MATWPVPPMDMMDFDDCSDMKDILFNDNGREQPTSLSLHPSPTSTISNRVQELSIFPKTEEGGSGRRAFGGSFREDAASDRSCSSQRLKRRSKKKKRLRSSWTKYANEERALLAYIAKAKAQSSAERGREMLSDGALLAEANKLTKASPARLRVWWKNIGVWMNSFRRRHNLADEDAHSVPLQSNDRNAAMPRRKKRTGSRPMKSKKRRRTIGIIAKVAKAKNEDEDAKFWRKAKEQLKDGLLNVTCYGVPATFDPKRLGNGAKGACIRLNDRQITPLAFEQACKGNRKLRSWSSTIRFLDQPVKALFNAGYLRLHCAHLCKCNICMGGENENGDDARGNETPPIYRDYQSASMEMSASSAMERQTSSVSVSSKTTVSVETLPKISTFHVPVHRADIESEHSVQRETIVKEKMEDVSKVICGGIEAAMKVSTFGSGNKGRCIVLHDDDGRPNRLTPKAFVKHCGMSPASIAHWARSIKIDGHPLYDLISAGCMPLHSAKACKCRSCSDGRTDEAVIYHYSMPLTQVVSSSKLHRYPETESSNGEQKEKLPKSATVTQSLQLASAANTSIAVNDEKKAAAQSPTPLVQNAAAVVNYRTMLNRLMDKVGALKAFEGRERSAITLLTLTVLAPVSRRNATTKSTPTVATPKKKILPK